MAYAAKLQRLVDPVGGLSHNSGKKREETNGNRHQSSDQTVLGVFWCSSAGYCAAIG
jgi:hypothetical protein